MLNDDVLDRGGLEPLSELPDWKIADPDTDVRGWQVLGHGDHLVGWIEDLMIDVRAERARYMVVRLDDNVRNEPNTRVLVPVGIAELHESRDTVVVPDLTRADIESLPPFERETFRREYEDAVRACFRATCEAGAPYYEHRIFDHTRLRRRRPAA